MRGTRYLLGLAGTTLIITLRASAALALDIPPVPTASPVVDLTNTLSEGQKQDLSMVIADEQTKSSNQIAILMIPTLAGDSLEDYSTKVARAWGIGTKEHNNGVLLLVVLQDRKLRIEVGYGLEGALPDARASQIIRNQITPQFREGRYYEGIKAGVQAIVSSIHGEYNASADNVEKLKGFDWETILIVLFGIPVWLSSILARSKSWWAGGIIGGIIGLIIAIFFGFAVIGIPVIFVLAALGLFFDWAVSTNYKSRRANGLSPSWWAGGTRLGGGGGSGSSGGFGGFGGGSFGGGGSSGSW